MKQKINIFALSLWIISFQIISFSIGMISRGNKDWYYSLTKSTYTPPGFVFGIVWPILYTALAVVGYLFWIKRDKFKLVSTLFAIQMILNWAWNPIFFGMKMIELSYLVLAAILILNICIIYESYKREKVIFYILLPYFTWICFAYYLTTMIFILN